MFDEEPDGDPHGECAAEIARLRGMLAVAVCPNKNAAGHEQAWQCQWCDEQRALTSTVGSAAEVIPHQSFHCPRCGAPGMVEYGQAQYSCMCRLGTYSMPPPAQEQWKCVYPWCSDLHPHTHTSAAT